MRLPCKQGIILIRNDALYETLLLARSPVRASVSVGAASPSGGGEGVRGLATVTLT